MQYVSKTAVKTHSLGNVYEHCNPATLEHVNRRRPVSSVMHQAKGLLSEFFVDTKCRD